MIPGLENAEFPRLGGIHRNTFINSPMLLDESLRLKSAPHLRFAGQITGVEGYVESAACGLMAGRFAAEELLSIEGGSASYPCHKDGVPPSASGSAWEATQMPHTQAVTPSNDGAQLNPSKEKDGPRHKDGVTIWGAGQKSEWQPNLPPRTTALGALLAHVTGDANAATFQPMNVNFGLFPPLTEKVKKDGRPQAYTRRALRDLAGWTGEKMAA
jgi:methylenetetrahydrofolate--tRNA-(uracil-5-)-methyltransferase